MSHKMMMKDHEYCAGLPRMCSFSSKCNTKIIDGFHSQRITAKTETVSGKVICMLVIPISVLPRLQIIARTDLSGQMLTFDGIWLFGEVLTSRINSSLHCTRQMADRVYGIVCTSGLMMSRLWTYAMNMAFHCQRI